MDVFTLKVNEVTGSDVKAGMLFRYFLHVLITSACFDVTSGNNLDSEKLYGNEIFER